MNTTYQQLNTINLASINGTTDKQHLVDLGRIEREVKAKWLIYNDVTGIIGLIESIINATANTTYTHTHNKMKHLLSLIEADIQSDISNMEFMAKMTYNQLGLVCYPNSTLELFEIRTKHKQYLSMNTTSLQKALVSTLTGVREYRNEYNLSI